MDAWCFPAPHMVIRATAMADVRPLPLLLLLLFFFSPASATASDTILTNSSIADGHTLVSAAGVFELGFFTPPGSTARFLGIWYKDISPPTVVWVANRQAPMSGATGSLAINGTGGGLVLADGSGRVFWTSAPSNVSEGNPAAKLLDSGNFVLRDGGGAGEVLWQSFDYPSDTLLPGMKFGWDLATGLDRYLTTWSSPGDPSPGDYTFKIDVRGAPEGFIWYNGTTAVYRNGPWNGLQFSGEPEMEPNNTSFRFEFVANRTDVYYTFAVDGSGILSRFVLNQSSAQRYVWLPPAGWNLYWSLPRDQCDQYSHCGAYGVCDAGASPMCGCLRGFAPVSPKNWALRDSSAGCQRTTRLNCTGDGFLPLRGVKLPDTTNATVDATISVDQCRQRCQANCSCVAYSASNIKGGDSGCIIWSTPLMDIRKFIYGGDDLYIRLAASDLPTGGDDFSRKHIVLAVILSLSGLLLLGLGAFFFRDKFFRNRGRSRSTRRLTSFDSSNHLTPVQDRVIGDETSHGKELNVTLFDINTIALSTDNFAKSAKLGEGGFGSVYKGELEGGQTVAVKRLSKYSTQGLDEFKNEVMLIAKLQHVNLVRLLGCCIHGEERMLVYEYMENKSLDNFIFDKARSAQLNWSRRFDIMLGIARGLLYLHQDSRFKVIHRDLKAGNILLDRDMNPKISDFGVARIFGDDTNSHTRKVVGTYNNGGWCCTVQWVHVAGVRDGRRVLGEVRRVQLRRAGPGDRQRQEEQGDVQQRRAGEPPQPRKRTRSCIYVLRSRFSNQYTLVCSRERWKCCAREPQAWKLWREGNALALLDEAVDAGGGGEYRRSEVLRCVQVGLLCVQERPEDRPNMAAVFMMLGNLSAVTPQPRHPGFCSDRGGSASTDGEWSSTCTVNDVTVTIVEGR